MIPFLGADPGGDGAAVLLGADGRSALLSACWIERESKAGAVWELFSDPNTSIKVPSIHHVANIIISRSIERLGSRAGAFPFGVAVERLFARPGVYLHGVTALAEATGELCGPLRSRAASFHRPLASQWRPQILGGAAMQSSLDAEASAWHRIAQVRPPLVDGLEAWCERYERTSEGRKTLIPRWPHVLEAACLARWGWLTQTGATQLALLADRK